MPIMTCVTGGESNPCEVSQLASNYYRSICAGYRLKLAESNKTVVDFGISSPKTIKNIKTYPRADVQSDHNPLIGRMGTS